FCANITPTLHRDTLSLHDALPIYPGAVARRRCGGLYVVEGDFVNEGKQYRPGTSLHVKTGKLHGAHGTEKGCKILVLRVNSRNRSEEHTSELQSRSDLVCRLLLEK